MKRTKREIGARDAYYVENTHPAIIDSDMFSLVQKEMQHRQSINDETVGTGRYSSKYSFSGLLECGICGHKMRRQVRIMGNKKKVPAWCCTYRVTNSRSV